MKDKNFRIIVIVVCLGAFILDQTTKFLADSFLTYATPLPILGDYFRLTLVYNYKGAFSISFGSPMVHTLLMGTATVFVLSYFVYNVIKRNDFLTTISFALITGGAFGNLADRLRMGRVVDFLEMGIPQIPYFWPVYNIADTSVVVGVAIFFVASMKMAKKEKQAKTDEQNTN